jgi:biotin carboxyl carrier protein
MAEAKIIAEMAGRLVSVDVTVGDEILQGQEIAVIESMKMEVPLTSTVSGVVLRVLAQPDEMIAEGDPILIVTLS